MTYVDLITSNDILTLRLQANSGTIPADTFISVLDAYERAIEAIEDGYREADDLERQVKSLEGKAEHAEQEIEQLEEQNLILKEALEEAAKLACKAG